MINILSIFLQAVHAEANLFRQYEIHLGKDLFDTWIVTVAYGRIGMPSQTRTYAFEDYRGIAWKVRQILKKRLGSFKRIGTSYHITETSLSTPIQAPETSDLIDLITNEIQIITEEARLNKPIYSEKTHVKQ